MHKAPVSVIVLTYNEEVNIKACLESAKDLTDEIFIVDSFSSDKTLAIAREYTEKIYQNPWTNGAGQRQWAIANLPFSYEWIFFLDADEWMTLPLKKEIARELHHEKQNPNCGGYYVPRKFIFLGKVIRWGDCRGGLKELRLCNLSSLEIRERAGWEIYKTSNYAKSLNESLIHEDKKPLTAWIERHNRYASLEAEYLYKLQNRGENLFTEIRSSTQDRRLFWKEAFRETFWHKLPSGFRPALLFVYYYFFRFGILDGMTGFIYHFLHTFWYRLLIDAKLLEFKRLNKEKAI